MASERIQDSAFRIRNQGLRILLCVDSHDVRRSVIGFLDLPDVDASLRSPIGRNTWTGSR